MQSWVLYTLEHFETRYDKSMEIKCLICMLDSMIQIGLGKLWHSSSTKQLNTYILRLKVVSLIKVNLHHDLRDGQIIRETKRKTKPLWMISLLSSVSDQDPGGSRYFDQVRSGSGWIPDPDTDPECEKKRTFFSDSALFLDFDAALT